MTDLGVTERRLRPIIDAVATGNWKQALQQCDKWQKKGEKSDRFLALKASILINQPDKSQLEKGKAETLQLCHRNPAVTDVEALYQLQESLKNLSLHREEGPKLWEKAIAARPTDKDLLITLLNGSISDGDWMSAQKAAMALRKAFPRERQYEFWNMLLCHLINQDTSLAQKDRDLFGRLAYMLMVKAAEAVPSDQNEVLSTGKAVTTPEELSLLVKIYNAAGHEEQAVKALQSDILGLQSRVGKLDPQFAFSLLLEALSVSKNQEEVFKTCKDLILSGSSISKEHQEDDRVWKIIRDIGRNQKTSETLPSDCQELAQSIYQSQKSCRAAYLAYFDLATQEKALNSEGGHESLASACIAHYEAFNQKPFCFGDLVRPLLLSDPALKTFNSKVAAKDGNPIQQAFDLKLRYTCLGKQDDDKVESESLRLVADAVRLHKEIPKDKSECPEMLLLAAETLLRTALRTRNNGYVIQASYLLHYCYINFNEFYPVAVRQVQLHLTQGQVSLALEKFASLAVKNMQWETIGHQILTRISTIHPWQSEDYFEATSPLGALDAGLTMLDNADRSLTKFIREGLTMGSYSNIIDSINVKSKMARSINRQLFLVEERRIQRLIGTPVDHPLDPYPADMVDQRDFSYIPDFGPYDGRDIFEESLTVGPLPKKTWLLVMALQDHVTSYLRSELDGHSSTSTAAFDRLKVISTKVAQQEHEADSQLTTEELSSSVCHQALSEALFMIKESPASKQGDFDATIGKLKSWLETVISSSSTGTSTVCKMNTPTWKFLHASFTELETLRIASNFLNLQARRTKTAKAGKSIIVSKDSLKELQQLVTDAEKAVHERAQNLKDGINGQGVLGRLVDTLLGRIEGDEVTQSDECKAVNELLAGLGEEAEVEEYCGRLKESWEESLNGILKVKLKITK